MTADEIARVIEGAAARHGVPTDALMAIANLESSGNINADNPRSSASGLFQFVDSTAREYGLTGNRRNDPAAQADAAAKMMATNARSLGQSLGREPNAGELYLAHQQGLTGARALLTNPSRPAIDVLTGVYGSREKAQNALRLNGGSQNQSAGQFAGQWVNKANQRAGLIPPSSIPNVVASQLDTTPQTRNVPRPQPRPDQRMIQGTSERPTSSASRAFPVMDATPRLAPALDGVFAYTPEGLQPAQIAGGIGSATPDFFRPQTRLPPLPPSPLASGRVVSISMDRANAARDPELQAALAGRIAQPSIVNTSMQRAAAANNPQLQAALEARNAPGVGLPPATRSVASAPIPGPRPAGPALSRDSVAQAAQGSYMAQALPTFQRTQPPPVLADPSAVPNAIPGPAPTIKTADALPAGIYPAMPQRPGFGVASALDVVPNAPGFPPMPRPRPVLLTMPTPVAQRPQAMPRMSLASLVMPTPVSQRPNPNALRVTVQGANSYGASPQQAPSREQQIAAILARSRGSAAFGGGGTIDGAVQPIGTLTRR